MNKGFYLLLGPVACCFALFGCNRAPAPATPPTENATVKGSEANETVSGQVFIVTKGGENFKLGLVHVLIAEDNEDAAEIESTSDRISKKLVEDKAKIDQKRADYDAAKVKYDAVLPDYENAEEALKNAEIGEGITAIGDDMVDGVDSAQAATIVQKDKAVASAGAKLAPLRDDMTKKYGILQAQIREQQDYVNAAVDTFFSYGNSVADTKTDADGRFTLLVPAGKKYSLIAKSSRTVGDSTETYYWDVPIDLSQTKDGLSILLSNDNEVSDPQSLFGFDFNLVVAELDDLPTKMYETIRTFPASFTFKTSTGDPVIPDMDGIPVSDSSTNSDTSSAPVPSEPPTWTPPDPLPKQDNWTWKTPSKTYEDVVIQGLDPANNTVKIMHSEGITEVLVTDLPADIQKALNYPPAPATAQAITNAPSTNAPASSAGP